MAKATQRFAAKAKTAMIQLLYPKAMPKTTFTAATDLRVVARARIGTYVCDVQYTVTRPMVNLPTPPLAAQAKAFSEEPMTCLLIWTTPKANP